MKFTQPGSDELAGVSGPGHGSDADSRQRKSPEISDSGAAALLPAPAAEASAEVADETGDENQGNRAHGVGNPGCGEQKHPHAGEGG